MSWQIVRGALQRRRKGRLGYSEAQMDVLSEVLKVVRLDAAIFFNAEFSSPWCVYSPPSSTVAPVLSPGSGHLIIYHFLTDGAAYIKLDDGTQLDLEAGEIVILPHGDAHTLGHGRTGPSKESSNMIAHIQQHGLEPYRYGGGGSPANFVCGFLACEPNLCQAVLGSLPPVFKVDIREDSSGQWLENSLRFSVAEALASRAGADAMLAKLSEVVFVETLRRYIASLPEQETGWLAGARDPEVGKALALLHRRPADPWTIANLAQQVGLSRSVLADRFRHFLGEPPMGYLTRWRMRLGARALATTNHSVAQIAYDVGYESEAAFNRAFKREFGTPPARYRTQARGSKDLPREHDS